MQGKLAIYLKDNMQTPRGSVVSLIFSYYCMTVLDEANIHNMDGTGVKVMSASLNPLGSMTAQFSDH